MTPTARSLEVLREMGYVAEVVERFIPRARVRRDLGGFGDVLAWHPALGILAVQATTGANAAARLAKALREPRLRTWLEAGGRFAVWSWRKGGARRKRKTWTVRVQNVTLADFERARGDLGGQEVA